MSKFQPGQSRRILPELKFAFSLLLLFLLPIEFHWRNRAPLMFHFGLFESEFHFLS